MMTNHDCLFHGQVAVVTGGARGLGFAISGLLAERGASVHILDRDSAALKQTIERLRSNGGAISGDVVDVTDEAAVIKIAERLATASSIGIGVRCPSGVNVMPSGARQNSSSMDG